MIMLVRIKERLRNIWSSIHEKIKQHWEWVEKSVTYKKVSRLSVPYIKMHEQKKIPASGIKSHNGISWYLCKCYELTDFKAICQNLSVLIYQEASVLVSNISLMCDWLY